MTIKERIIKHLKEKGTYSSDVDDIFVDDLVDNIELAKGAMERLKTEGITTTYLNANGVEITKMNPLVSIYQMLSRNINQLATKLGISRMDRIKFKIQIEEEEQDEFDKTFDKTISLF